MRVVVIGLGTQGHKRALVAGDAVVAIVDPIAAEATHRAIEDVELDSYDAALVCTPDKAKYDILRWLAENGKDALVEKPLTLSPSEFDTLDAARQSSGALLYTAYNHRFEPHLVRVASLLAAETIGRVLMLNIFYGNGTARDVQNSPWRDQGLGVIADLGSHMLNLVDFLLPRDPGEASLIPTIRWARRLENASYDIFSMTLDHAGCFTELQGSLVSWKNTFRLDVVGDAGSLHVDGLCKWGPSTLRIRERVLPSGRPTETEVVLEEPDPTWQAEYSHFQRLCSERETAHLHEDRIISGALHSIEHQLSGREL